MKKWILTGLTVATLTSASVALVLLARRLREVDPNRSISEQIATCMERIQRLEADLRRRRPSEAVG